MNKKNLDILKFFFKQKDISQEQLSKDLATTQPAINAMLNGRRNISKKTAQKLHDLYGLSVGWLLTGEGEMMASNQATTINIGRDSIKVGGDANGASIQQGGSLTDVVEKLVNELAEQRKANNKQQELINSLIQTFINQQNKGKHDE